MQAGDRLIDDLAGAILDGAPIDWPSAESSADRTDHLVIRELKLLAALAEVHRDAPADSIDTLGGSSVSLAKRTVAEAPELWGHLRLLERIGRGAFGEVHRAWDTRLDREVALKLLPAGPSSGDRAASAIIHEGRLLARVHHPNVVTIYGAEQIGDQIGLWMEFVRGYTLDQILEQRKVVSATEAVDIGLELCRAMSAVHGAGLLHRDIKAHNVMRAEDGRIVLMDFGTGRELEDDAASDLVGTPLYLAPEVLQGQQATVRSDIYSLGVLLYHLVSGSYPVHARTVREVRRAHERGERNAVTIARPDLGSKLARVIERAIDPDPKRRYQSADALAADLAALKPRPKLVPLAYALGVAAVLVLLLWVAGEMRGRQMMNRSTPRITLAVLPFANLSGDPSQEYFSDGLTEEMIAQLSIVNPRGLGVLARTSAMRYKHTQKGADEIGKELDVDFLVEGSVRRENQRIRISAQLVRASDQIHVWAKSYERDLREILVLQEEVARDIAKEINVSVSPAASARRSTVAALNPAAYEAYIKGRYFWNKRTKEGLWKAIEYFQDAIRDERAYAAAYDGLADSWIALGWYGYVSPKEAFPQADEAARRALAFDDSLAAAHTSLAFVRFNYDWDWSQAERGFQRAIELDSDYPNAHHWYADYLSAIGRHEQAVAESERARRLDPLSPIINAWLGWRHYFARQYDAAVEQYRRTLELDHNFAPTHLVLGQAYEQQGRVSEALAELQQAEHLARGGPLYVAALAHALAGAGRRADAERELRQLVELSARQYVPPVQIAIVHAGLGHAQEAIEWLEKGIDERSPGMVWIKGDPRFDSLRHDSRFQDIVSRVRFP